MSETSQNETVSRLKELLFDREVRELDALHRRLADMHARAGSDEQFQEAVAKVLDSAIRQAETTRHRELSEAMSPMVLRTLRAEMGSREMEDQIAGMMYPRMGEMVGRYVSSAFRDLMQQINRRLEAGLVQNRFALWFRSISSGRSMAELALAATQQLEVQEIYLVQRGSGALVHHWSRAGMNGTGGNNRDTLVSGFLAAITALAEDVFEADKESLRTLDLDDHRIYLRGSPAYLLAAKCAGSAPAGIDRSLDTELLRVLAENQTIEQEAGAGGSADLTPRRDTLLAAFSAHIEDAARARTAEISRAHGMRTLKIAAWLIGLPLAAFAGWYFYVSFITQSLQAKADGAIAGIAKLKGYPVKAHVERGARRVWVTGLTPDEATRRTLLTELKELAPDAELSETLNVLPKSDVQARLAAEGFRRSQERAERKLTTLVADLATARSRLQDDAVRDALAEVGAAGQSALAEVRRPRADGDIDRVDDGLKAAFDGLGRAAETLARMAGAETAPPQRAPEDATEAADALALGSERIGALAAALEQRLAVAPIAKRIDDVAAARSAEAVRLAEERLAELDRRYRARLDELERRLGQQTPRQRLAELARSHAVFFSNDSEYRDPRATGALLDQIARLMRETDASLRVVGYTDDVGSSARNSPISQARAERVVADLAARGVPANRMIAVGRPSGAPIAPGSGAESPNRRAEFELAFSGERGGRP